MKKIFTATVCGIFFLTIGYFASSKMGFLGLGKTQIVTTILDAPQVEKIEEIGVTISSKENLGETKLTLHKESTTINSHPTINRTILIEPENDKNLQAEIILEYEEDELNGIDESQLILYSSTDNGKNWVAHRSSIVDIENNSIRLNGVEHFSLWTAASSSTMMPVTGICDLDLSGSTSYNTLSYQQSGSQSSSTVNALVDISDTYYGYYYDAAGACYSSANSGVTVTLDNCIAIIEAPILRCNVNTGDPVSFNITGQNTDSNFETEFILTNSAGVIQYASSSLPMMGVDAGGYLAFSINYDTTGTIPTIQVGDTITNINGSCVDISAPLPYGVCDCNDDDGNLIFSNTGQNTDTTYQQIYVLTDSINNIIDTSSTAEFNHLDDGIYNVFALNTKIGDVIINYTSGNNISDITGNCFDLSEPLGYAVCNEAITLDLKVLLQGALMGGTDTLMRDSLRHLSMMPMGQPYGVDVVDDRFTHIDGGDELTTAVFMNPALDPTKSFVDWVFIEFRSAADSSEVIQTMAALVQRDGSIRDAATGDLIETEHLPSEFYLAIKHRNHLGIMTASAVQPTNDSLIIDFTSIDDADLFNYPGYEGMEMATVNGKKALWAGNADLNGKVKYDGNGSDQLIISNNVITHPDNSGFTLNFNVAYGYYPGDINLDGKVKYDGFNNDRILLQSNALTYPLNTGFLNNYDLMLEQIPE